MLYSAQDLHIIIKKEINTIYWVQGLKEMENIFCLLCEVHQKYFLKIFSCCIIVCKFNNFGSMIWIYILRYIS